MTRAEEQELIARARCGDALAITALIKGHQDSLYAFMLRMSGRPEVAEDVVQEAFVRVLKNLDRFDPKYRFSTWLFTIAKRLYVNWVQKFHPASESEIVDGWRGNVAAPDVRAVMEENQARARLAIEHGLASLGEVQREIVLLFHQQNWSITDISDYLEMPEGTIKSHLHRARRKMREAIEQAGVVVEETLGVPLLAGGSAAPPDVVEEVEVP